VLSIIEGTVPLSDHEQRILDEIEKNLYQEDPSFAHGVRRRSPRLDKRARARLGIITFLIGFATLIAFFIAGSLFLGVLAFGAMVAGIVLVAGSFGQLAGASRAQRVRVSQLLSQWEERMRQRYKR